MGIRSLLPVNAIRNLRDSSDSFAVTLCDRSGLWETLFFPSYGKPNSLCRETGYFDFTPPKILPAHQLSPTTLRKFVLRYSPLRKYLLYSSRRIK